VTDLHLDQEQGLRVFGRSAGRLLAFGRRGAEIVEGNAINVDDLQMSFKDAGAALVVLPDDVTDPRFVSNRSQMSWAITQALRDHHVGHIVLASSIGAGRDRGVGPVAGLHELEELLFGLEDANVLSLRAAWHMACPKSSPPSWWRARLPSTRTGYWTASSARPRPPPPPDSTHS